MLGSACQAIGLLLFSLVDSLGGLFVVAAAFGFGFSGLIPNYLTTVRELFAASEASWRMPTLQLFTLGGMAAGTWLAGWIFDITADYRYAFAIGVGSILSIWRSSVPWRYGASGCGKLNSTPHWRADNPRFDGCSERTLLALPPSV